MKQLILLLCILLSFTNCSNDDDNDSDKIEFTIIHNGALHGNGDENIQESNLVIDNTATWNNLIDKMNTRNQVSDNFTETYIDFDKYLVIAVFLDVKRYGWEVEINNIIEHANSLVVTTNENPLVNPVITQPYSIVKISKTEKDIKFD